MKKNLPNANWTYDLNKANHDFFSPWKGFLVFKSFLGTFDIQKNTILQLYSHSTWPPVTNFLLFSKSQTTLKSETFEDVEKNEKL